MTTEYLRWSEARRHIRNHVHNNYMGMVLGYFLDLQEKRAHSYTITFPADQHEIYREELNCYSSFFEFNYIRQWSSENFVAHIETQKDEFKFENLLLTNVSNKLRSIYFSRPEFDDTKCIITGGIVSVLINNILIGTDEYYKYDYDIDFFIYGKGAKVIASAMEFHKNKYELLNPIIEDYYGSKTSVNPDMLVFYSHPEWNYKLMDKSLKVNVIVKPKCDTIESIISEFDFEHCKPYWDNQTERLYISEEQYGLIMKKKLQGKWKQEKRFLKYQEKGWKYE